MTAGEFVIQMKSLKVDYRRNDAYVERFIPWNDDAWYDKSILAAYKMYKLVKSATIPVLPLGDEGIRKMEKLLFNFGLASATGIQDIDLQGLVDQLQIERDKLKKSRGWFEPFLTDRKVPDVLGPGQILSDQTWTTALNDAFIGGGIDAGHTFVLALSDKPTKGSGSHFSEQEMWRKTVANANQYFQRDNRSYEEKWRSHWVSFFQNNLTIIYTAGRRIGPRVLARELLGLSFFGYKAVCTEYQLSFEKKIPTAKMDFRVYMRKLDDLNFFANFNANPSSRQLVISAILSFISGRPFNYRELL
jgi:hypothetical protein